MKDFKDLCSQFEKLLVSRKGYTFNKEETRIVKDYLSQLELYYYPMFCYDFPPVDPEEHSEHVQEGYSEPPEREPICGLQMVEEGNGTFCKDCGSTMQRRYRILWGFFQFGKILYCHNEHCDCKEEAVPYQRIKKRDSK